MESLRDKQLKYYKYKKFVINPEEITVLSKQERIDIKSKFPQLLSFEIIKIVQSSDSSTYKVLLKTKNSNLIFESVLLIHDNDRNTVCVSCMVGCPLNCTFCATGKMGFKKNLTAEEIVDQIVFWGNYLKERNKRVTNVVFMGMGEPLLNVDEILKSYNIITDKDFLGFSPSRLTISTAGIIPGIETLTHSGYMGNLALSLHSADQKIREKIMPIAKVYKLDAIKTALKLFQKTNKNRITFEYIMIDDLNIGETDVKKIKDYVKNFNHLVNLIPYNKVNNCSYTRPSRNKMFKFKQLLESNKLNATFRYTMGDDESSACGQLTTQNGG